MITQASCAFLCLFVVLAPLALSNRSTLAYLLLTTLLSIPLHYEVPLRIIPWKNHFYFTWLDKIPKNLHYIWLIHLFQRVSCPTKTCIEILNRLGPWWVSSFFLRSVHLMYPMLEGYTRDFVYVKSLFTHWKRRRLSSRWWNALPFKSRAFYRLFVFVLCQRRCVLYFIPAVHEMNTVDIYF